MAFVVYILLLASLGGSGMLLWAAWLTRRFREHGEAHDFGAAPSVSLFKPLHGAEPRLFDNLATAIEQHYDGSVEIIFGVAQSDDPAIAVVDRLRARHPRREIAIVIDPRSWGANAKVSNLVNMAARARHEVIVLADSDMAVPRDYLNRLIVALERSRVGAVSCLYVGRGDAGFWSRLTALGIDLHFLPATLIGLATGLGHPCMGSTIALHREMLDEIGGFVAFADTLADDHAIGAAVRAAGREVAVPDMLLTHGCAETRFAALLRQELRWNATIAGIDPIGYAGSVILHPLPLAIVAWLFGGGFGAVLVALAARAVVAVAVSRVAPPGRSGRDLVGAILFIPVRDLLSFGLFLTSFAVRSVDWRGTAINIGRKGQVSTRKDIRP